MGRETQILEPIATQADDAFGSVVAIDGGAVLVDAPLMDQGSEPDAGEAFVSTTQESFMLHRVSGRCLVLPR